MLFIFNAYRDNSRREDDLDCDIEVEEKISCSNLECPDFEKWYNFSDINIREPPAGEWYCSEGCRQIGCESLKIPHVIDEAMDSSELIIRGPSRRAARSCEGQRENQSKLRCRRKRCCRGLS